MAYITDPAEASSTLGRPVEGPVYKAIRGDADGCEVAVPVFRIKHNHIGKGYFQKKGGKGRMDYTSAIIHIVQKITDPRYLARIYALARYIYIKLDSGNEKAQAPASNLDLK